MPGDVLMQDLVPPGTQAIMVPVGTVLTAEVIMKIRQAGLEALALECIANKKAALHEGINLKRFDPRAVLTATELAQMRAERLVDSAMGLRTVLYLLLGATTVMAVASRSPEFMFLMGLVYLGLVGAYTITAAIADGHKRNIISLKHQEQAEAEQKRKFLERVTQGDPEAVAEVVIEGVVGKNRMMSLEIEKGYIILHALTKDALEIAKRGGVQLEQRSASPRDPASVRSHRIATSNDVHELLSQTHEVLAGVFAFSPSTYTMALSLYDPFEDPIGHTHYLGCITSVVVDRYQFEAMAREGNMALLLGRDEAMHMEFERNGPFHEVAPAAYSLEAV